MVIPLLANQDLTPMLIVIVYLSSQFYCYMYTNSFYEHYGDFLLVFQTYLSRTRDDS